MIQIKVVDIMGQGRCPLGIAVGDEFSYEHEPPEGMCHWAFHGLFPLLTTLRFGGNIPWEDEPGIARACCLDPNNPVVFELRRLEAAEVG